MHRTWGALLLSPALLCAVTTRAAEPARTWPQFRGPQRDGISTETGLRWPEKGPQVLWRAELGEGFSGLAIVDGRIFTLAGRGDAAYVVGLEAASGRELWKRRIEDEYTNRFGNGPRSTPTVDGDTVYALGAQGRLVALGTEDGAVRWQHDLVAEYEVDPPRWGIATSPLVEGRLLLVNVGGADGASIVAFDKNSGKEVWRALDEGAGYSAPIAATISGQRQVVVLAATRLVSIAPGDGTLLWELPWKTMYDVNASTPLFVPPNRVFVSTGYDKGCALLEIAVSEGKARVEEIWRNREMKNQFSSSLLHDGHIYGFDDKTLKSLDLEKGTTLWRKRGFGHGSLIYADGYLIVLSDRGRLAFVEATPEEYREIGSVQLFDGRTWTVPALLDGKLYIRDEKEVISVRISG